MMSFKALEQSRPVADSRADSRSLTFPGMDCAVMPKAVGLEIALTVKPLPGEELRGMFNRLAKALNELGAAIVHLMVFGDVSACAAGTEAMRRAFGGVDWPVTWVEGAACDGHAVAGLQVFAFAGGEVRRCRVGGHIVGSVFEDGAFRHCLVGGLGPERNCAPRGDQTKLTLEHLEGVLTLSGFSFAEVVRTWFFLDKMLAWYDEFNRVRTQAYSGIRFRAGSLPASTGVGGRNPGAAALVAAAWAVQPMNATACAREVVSPLQCPAPAYGSSFSRAVELSSSAGRRLLISGTASIAADGRTLWQEDAGKQVAQTMEVVEALLQSRGLSVADVTRAAAYFKRRSDTPFFREWCGARGWSAPPVVFANCDVCRDDLRFELELDAWQPNSARDR